MLALQESDTTRDAIPIVTLQGADLPRYRAGRPTAYRPEYADIARKLIALRASDAEIAEYIGVDITTLIDWRLNHPAFSKAITRTADEIDSTVEVSLSKRATGFQHLTRKVFGPTKDTDACVVEYFDNVMPDVNAARLWLSCRKPKQWREKTGGDDVDSHRLADSLRTAILTIAQESRAHALQLQDITPGADDTIGANVTRDVVDVVNASQDPKAE